MGQKAEHEPTVDAVAMTRRIRDVQHAELAGRTWEERVAYYHEKAQELHRSLNRSEVTEAEIQRAV